MGDVSLTPAAGPLRGRPALPGDKSISHRALILAAMAVGESRIAGLNRGADVAATAAALEAMGVGIEIGGDGTATVHGVGTGALLQPEGAIDCGNSGTTARLIAGLIAGHPIRAVLTGDASLSRRPMARVAEPLARTGARVDTAPGGTLPMLIEGACPALPCRHALDLPSAQVKSALLFAGLNAPGFTEVEERVPTRDHSERLLKLFGADIAVEGPLVRLRGEAELAPRTLSIPKDPSAAAFLAVAAAIVPGSEVRLDGLCVNPRRFGLLAALREMGADLILENRREQDGEPIADLIVRHAPLRALDLPPERVPDLIDELAILFVAAAFAEGRSRFRGLAELRVKESDRLAAMAAALRAAGVPAVEESEDGLVLHGTDGAPLPGGARIAAQGDHRVAMSLAVAGLRSREPLSADAMDSVSTSFPNFTDALAGLAP